MGIIRQYLALCWFDASPLELDRSTQFLKFNLIFNFLIYFFIQFNMTDDIESITEVIFETLLSVGFIALTLWLNNTAYAFVQACSAVLFCQNVLALFLVPIMFWATVAENWPSYTALLLVVLWNWIVTAAIFKRSLSINMLAGLVMSFFYLLMSFGGGFAINSFVSG